MTEHEVYLKVKQAIDALNNYHQNLNGSKGPLSTKIEKGLETLTEKRHMLASSGEKCSCCGGSGRG